MIVPKINNPQLVQLASTYWLWRSVWLTTTTAFFVLGLFYVLFLKSDTWVASQGIIIRDEANGAVMRLGRFQSQTEMKAAQETILEMARNAQVVSDALLAVGRPKTWFGRVSNSAPPTTSEVDDLARSGIQVRAPRGAELGTTEVIYIDVKQSSPTRAVALNLAVCDALENRMQQVRKARADGVISELQSAKNSAETKLQAATEQLKQIEEEAGADLSDLRGMTDANSGGGSNRLVLDTIKTELRQAELQLQQLQTDLNQAADSFENPDQLLLTPSSLVNSQAGLKTLRDGLANATITTSQLQGRYTPEHPLVVAALEAEAKMRQQLRSELGTAAQTLGKDVEIAFERVSKLKSQQLQLESRLEKIASIRAVYSNVASEVKSRNTQLQECERELSQAQAARQASMTSSLITRIDKPMLGEKPIGPGRSSILLGATASGMLFGLGLVFLLSPLEGGASFGRRKFDFSGNAGRRASDRDEMHHQESAAQPNATHRVAANQAAIGQLGPSMSEIAALAVPGWIRSSPVAERAIAAYRSWTQVKNTQRSKPARATTTERITRSNVDRRAQTEVTESAKPAAGLPLSAFDGSFASQASSAPTPKA